MWADLQEEYGDQVEFIIVDRDTDAGDAFARSHGLIGQPGFVVFDAAGALTYASLGPYRESGLRELVLSIVPE